MDIITSNETVRAMLVHVDETHRAGDHEVRFGRGRCPSCESGPWRAEVDVVGHCPSCGAAARALAGKALEVAA